MKSYMSKIVHLTGGLCISLYHNDKGMKWFLKSMSRLHDIRDLLSSVRKQIWHCGRAIVEMKAEMSEGIPPSNHQNTLPCVL